MLRLLDSTYCSILSHYRPNIPPAPLLPPNTPHHLFPKNMSAFSHQTCFSHNCAYCDTLSMPSNCLYSPFLRTLGVSKRAFDAVRKHLEGNLREASVDLSEMTLALDECMSLSQTMVSNSSIVPNPPYGRKVYFWEAHEVLPFFDVESPSDPPW